MCFHIVFFQRSHFFLVYRLEILLAGFFTFLLLSLLFPLPYCIFLCLLRPFLFFSFLFSFLFFSFLFFSPSILFPQLSFSFFSKNVIKKIRSSFFFLFFISHFFFFSSLSVLIPPSTKTKDAVPIHNPEKSNFCGHLGWALFFFFRV